MRFGLETTSIPGKLVQMFYALQLERHYTKEQILEAYFTLAPYGGNVEGANAAAMVWCGKECVDLTPREAVALAVIPQSPSTRQPRRNGDNPSLARAQFRLWRRLSEADGRRVDPLDAEFSIRAHERVPRGVPHLARRVLTEHPNSERVVTTIDSRRQGEIEQAINDYVARHRELGITNACALLVHAPTREVRAYVGSAEFLGAEIHGQVDGVTARRSPGSALKPFVYALAVDRGLIHGRTLVRDARRSFGDYNPENFDRGFVGPIAAADALYASRNIPAVSLAAQLGDHEFYDFLKRCGIRLPEDSEHYGLSLPLGGGEVSMEEMGQLYAMLATDGRPLPLRFSGDEAKGEAIEPVLSPAACFVVRDMLRPREYDLLADDPEVHWKTGTSHGFRDGWAAAVYGDYVLIVWVGNFDGKGNPAFVARESAGPLLFEMLGMMRLPTPPDTPPMGVKRLNLCAVSGALPGKHCSHIEQGWFLPGVSPIEPCTVHREVLIDVATGRRVMDDDGTHELRREVFEFWPSDMLELFRLAGLPRRQPPEMASTGASLLAADRSHAPLIVSPQQSVVYSVDGRDGGRKRVPLRVDASPGVSKVFWFVDDRFVGASAPEDVCFWQADPGEWVVQVVDDLGRSNSTQVTVESVPR